VILWELKGKMKSFSEGVLEGDVFFDR